MRNAKEWQECEDSITEALKSIQTARRSCPEEQVTLDLLNLEILLCGIGANLPNFLIAQYELEGEP